MVILQVGVSVETDIASAAGAMTSSGSGLAASSTAAHRLVHRAAGAVSVRNASTQTCAPWRLVSDTVMQPTSDQPTGFTHFLDGKVTQWHGHSDVNYPPWHGRSGQDWQSSTMQWQLGYDNRGMTGPQWHSESVGQLQTIPAGDCDMDDRYSCEATQLDNEAEDDTQLDTETEYDATIAMRVDLHTPLYPQTDMKDTQVVVCIE